MPKALEFRPIPGWFGYYATTDGDIYSRWELRSLGNKGNVAIIGLDYKCLIPSLCTNGYLAVTLYKEPNKGVRLLIHRLILETFVGPCPEGMESRHLNGKKFNNSIENLCWGTKLENAADKERHGTVCRGEKHPQAKLSRYQVDKILSLRGTASHSEIAKKFNISKTCVTRIIGGKAWYDPKTAQL